MWKGVSVHCTVKNIGLLGCTLIHSFALACSVCDLQGCSAVCMNTVTRRCTMFTRNKPIQTCTTQGSAHNHSSNGITHRLWIWSMFTLPFNTPSAEPAHRTENIEACVSQFVGLHQSSSEALLAMNDWWQLVKDKFSHDIECPYLVHFFTEHAMFSTNRKCHTIPFCLLTY